MPRTDDLMKLPENLPVPVDDGACDHLAGMRLPPVLLPSTRGGTVDLAKLRGRTVVYIYPVFPPDRNAGKVAAWLRGNP